MSIKNLLTEREERITKELKKLENKLNKLPEGLLVCNYRNGKVRWYEERTENGKRQRHYLSKRTDSSRIDDLVHKTYFTYKKRELEAELVGIGDCVIKTVTSRVLFIRRLSIFLPAIFREILLSSRLKLIPIH